MNGPLPAVNGTFSVAVVEPDDGRTSIAEVLAAEGFAVNRVVDPAAGAPGAVLLVVASRALPAGGMEELLAAMQLGPGTPALLVRDAADGGADGPAWLTWPVSGPALAAVCQGLVSGVAAPALQARTPADALSGVLYQDVVNAAAAALTNASERRLPDLGVIRLVAERIHSQLLRDNQLVNRSLEPHGAYDLASHSANVAIIAGKIGIGRAIGVEDIVRAIMAGIVHDIGMAMLPESLVTKPSKLTPEELEQVRTHPVLGAELLGEVERRHEWLQTVVLQEHERIHGQGYPAGLRGAAIDPLAQIIGLADVFEALSHPRSYRSPYTALEALEQVSEMKGEYFDPGMVATLVNEISAFPLDSYVQLSTGEIGQVISTNPENILRPEIVIRWDSSWTPVDPVRRIDLATAPDVTVARALLEAELPIT